MAGRPEPTANLLDDAMVEARCPHGPDGEPGWMRIRRYAYPAAGMACIGLLALPEVRAGFFYSFIPLLCLSALLSAPPVRRFPLLALAIAVGAWLHIYSFRSSAVQLEPDSHCYIAWARSLSQGHGFGEKLYRPPLYPAVIGLTFLSGANTMAPLVALQHLVLLACVPLLYYLAVQGGFGRGTAILASFLFVLNSLVMQMAQEVMTEAIFLALVLAAALCLVKSQRDPSIRNAVVTGAVFGLAAHLRELLGPFLVLFALYAWIHSGKRGLRHGAAAIAVAWACMAPWSVRNLVAYGSYGVSLHGGLNLFTKLTSYHLENREGRYFKGIAPTYANALHDLGLDGYSAPEHPEDDWTLNQVPHAVLDSLVSRHGYTFTTASRALTAASIEGFAAHPARYGASVALALGTLLFSHRELYPSISAVLPVPQGSHLPVLAVRLARGLVYAPGWFLLLYGAMLLVRRTWSFGAWLPLVMCLGAYTATALVQVGFTRYTVPWLPLQSLCAAALVDRTRATLLRAGRRVWPRFRAMLGFSRT